MNSAEKAVFGALMRVWWHLLFDPMPMTAKCLGSELNSVFERFVADSEMKGISLDWQIHLHFLRFLVEQNILSLRDSLHYQEFFAAAAARWAGTTKGPFLAIEISGSGYPGYSVIGLKEQGPLLNRKVLKVPQAKICSDLIQLQMHTSYDMVKS